jgi:hypothetical protein
MKQQARRDEFESMLYSLTNEGVEFRNRLRGWIGMAAWLVLSGMSMIIMLLGSGAKGQLNIAIVIGMSLVKYVPLLMVVYSLARMMTARYLDDVYELHDEDLASDFLEEVTFGYGHEKITIHEGKISERDEESPVILIGGPGIIQVNLDSVALLEKVTGEPEVIYPRSAPWKLGRFERIREIGKYDELGKREYAIINLRDQFVSGLSVKSRTKDGIPMEAHEIKVIFSLLRRQAENNQVQGDAYLFDERAVQALVYNQTIITPQPGVPSGITFPWDTTVIPLIISELEELIKSHNLGEILASISQKELDTAFNNDQTVAQMRLEMTGQLVKGGGRKEAPKFASRSKITAQFFEKEFREKAAKLGVAIEWIDIGTWQLPSSLIPEKHRQAWDLSRENAKKRSDLERSRKKHEMEEILKLVDSVIIRNFEKSPTGNSKLDKEFKALLKDSPDLLDNPAFSRQNLQQEMQKKDTRSIAMEILNAFRRELRAGKELIEKNRSLSEEKIAEINSIEKALFNITHLTTQSQQKP